MLELMINNEIIQEEYVAPDTMLLSYLREQQGLTGTKEGCGSGDCGACTVVMVDLDAQSQLRYRQINACITPVNALHGKQILTVEHLKQGRKLHPVQQLVADLHGSQCGFCTPGVVMSLYALSKQPHKPDDPTLYLAGNLCRCTGYGPLIQAAEAVASQDCADPVPHNTTAIRQWMQHVGRQQTPHYFKPVNRAELAQVRTAHPEAWLIAGGTDLSLAFTQRYEDVAALIDVTAVDDLLGIEETAFGWRLGAAVSLADFHQFMAEHYPSTDELLTRLGSLTIRHRGTLGGSLGNASPIGDIAPLVISLGGYVEVDDGTKRQQYAVEEFITRYRHTRLTANQWISAIGLPKLMPNQIHAIYKVSKRKEDDISTVVLAIKVSLEGQRIVQARVAAGGIAATPVRLIDIENLMEGQPLTQSLIAQVKGLVPLTISPLSDVRASAHYRTVVMANLFQRFYLEWRQVPARMENHA